MYFKFNDLKSYMSRSELIVKMPGFKSYLFKYLGDLGQVILLLWASISIFMQ